MSRVEKTAFIPWILFPAVPKPSNLDVPGVTRREYETREICLAREGFYRESSLYNPFSRVIGAKEREFGKRSMGVIQSRRSSGRETFDRGRNLNFYLITAIGKENSSSALICCFIVSFVFLNKTDERMIEKGRILLNYWAIFNKRLTEKSETWNRKKEPISWRLMMYLQENEYALNNLFGFFIYY